MPSNTSFPNQKEHEERLLKFQLLIDAVLGYASQYLELRKNIMAML